MSEILETVLRPDGSRKRVLVAMSGGVDSSVAAALLVEQGYDVVGVTMQVWDYSTCDIEEGHGTCCSSVDVDDARSVADRLGFPFYVMNVEAKFQTYVIDPFIGAYLEGKTPLPCVNCNTYLKFDHLIRKMRELDCDYLATGHYARIDTELTGRPQIITSTDDWKDQTYFLFTTEPEVIPHLMFPIGHLRKPDVRIIAEERGLVNARKKDSTGICFVGDKGYDNFIEERVAKDILDMKKGSIRLFPTGEVIAKHEGIHHYTYGQRKGLGVYRPEPMYVVKIDASTNDVWVGEEQHLYGDKAHIVQAHLIDSIEDGERLRVKIRFQHKGDWARVFKKQSEKGTEFSLEFEQPVRAITPGQAAVFYRDQQLVGGGWVV
ncbi:MAG: tRNA 2-thiouridine(34) synthase MnmA [Proteobacteria bacterium]|nr:MAG: tRNA 2-thiouridine(34) synthase MnmA [Pseudomonadota bacterium]